MATENKSVDTLFSTALAKFLGDLALPMRVVVGWMYFSAFLRRLFYATGKMDPHSPLWVGGKVEGFWPHAIFVGPIILNILHHLEFLALFLWVFTILEGITGSFLILGLFTRPIALVSTGLYLALLLPAGWIGTTCLDEWQIGVTGIGMSLVLFLTGGGHFSLDNLIFKGNSFIDRIFEGFIARNFKNLVIGLTIFSAFMTLFSYQYFFSGLTGPLHNPSKPIDLAFKNIQLNKNGDLKFWVARVGGNDVYGAFITKISVIDGQGKEVLSFNPQDLSKAKVENEINIHKVTPNQFSIIVPLGARAIVEVTPSSSLNLSPGTYKIKFYDVSGKAFEKTVTVQ